MDNASDIRQIRAAKKAAQTRDAERATVWFNIMASSAGRSFIYDRLVRCHIFTNSFSSDPYRTAFSEGERNIGLQDLSDIMRWAPDQYIQMMREASDREQADGRSAANRADTRGPDSGSDTNPLITPIDGADGAWNPET